jgi:beta-mannosidase
LLVSCEETGELQAEAGLGEKCGARLCVTNDTLSAVLGELVWEIRDANSNIICGGREEFSVPSMTAKWIDELDLGELLQREYHIHFALIVDGNTVSEGTRLFCAPKNYNFVSPKLEARVDGNEIVVISHSYAKAVEIYSDSGNVLLDDNFFDMEAGEKRVKILAGSPENIRIKSIYGVS